MTAMPDPRTLQAAPAEGAGSPAPGLPHLEIYLSDPRRTKPEKLRTVLLLETAG